MRALLLAALVASGCASAARPASRADDGPPQGISGAGEIAYECSNNARLCRAYAAALGSKSRAEIRFFIEANATAWAQVAAEVASASRR